MLSETKENVRKKKIAGKIKSRIKNLCHTFLFGLLDPVLRLGAVFLLSLAVSSRTCTDTHLEASPAQHPSPGERNKEMDTDVKCVS